MRFQFFFEHGNIPEIGTGHMYRAMSISKELRQRGHQTQVLSSQNDELDGDILVIDHLFSQTNLILRAKNAGMKIILIDGAEEDVPMIDLSISAFFNKKAQYSGIKYMAFPLNLNNRFYDVSLNDGFIFISMGGFDSNSLAELAITAVENLGLRALVTKSINHFELCEKYSNIIVFDGIDYYKAMEQCIAGITAGGLTLFQSLHFGLPCIAIPQYSHQDENISFVSDCCVSAKNKLDDLIPKLKMLTEKSRFRKNLSYSARSRVDGRGIVRICNLIDNLFYI